MCQSVSRLIMKTHKKTTHTHIHTHTHTYTHIHTHTHTHIHIHTHTNPPHAQDTFFSKKKREASS